MSGKPVRRSARLKALATDDDEGHSGTRGGGGAAELVTIGKFELLESSDHTKTLKILHRPPLYLAKTISYSQLISMAYDPRTASGMVTLQNNLNGLVHKLERGGRLFSEENNGLSLKITPIASMSAFDLGYVLPSSTLLHPHWKVFSEALENWQAEYFSCFVGFVSVCLDTAVLDILSPGLTAQRLTSLYFSSNGLLSYGVVRIAHIVSRIPTLESLSICRNNIGYKEDWAIARLSKAIRYHPNLRRLNLMSCGIGDNEVLLSCIRNRMLSTIGLEKNNITPQGAYYIAKFLAKARNRLVTEVRLSGNQIGDRGAALLASALKINRTLLRLDLQGNRISYRGKLMLLKALCDDSSLNSMSDSNHVCRVTLEEEELNYQDEGEMGGLTNLVQSMNHPRVAENYGRVPKLLSRVFAPALHMTENLRYFDGLPPELVPEAFSLIQYEKTGYCKRLLSQSLIFQLLRAMPFIFAVKNRCQVVVSRKSSWDSNHLEWSHNRKRKLLDDF